MHSTKFWSNMKKDISANLHQKCLILCRRILLNVLYNTSLSVWLPWQHTGFQTSPILKAFLPPLLFHFPICKWCLICMIQQAYKYVSSSLWPHLRFFELKITNILKSSGWGLEKSKLPWQQNFLIAVGVLPVELLAYQVVMVYAANWPRQIYLYTWYYIGLSVWHHQWPHLHILHTFQTEISPELSRYLQMVNSIFILSSNSMWYA